ncbi:phage shock protein PspC (stress-responsive transcriptional regulator) [Flavobacterium sp. PL11]|uniref:PspC domain-containing protein n=1 Tax=Flavobacterium sp. PL11 TaxID=3071717 RepID=UPI002DF846B7|nr:phage shock protein PspC (stress-responsive transcriptional regulator) [Flavobacterium sp. PL11]
MNKTVNINLGGMFYHIDEDAYQKLTRYFDAIKRSLSNSSGHDEIIKDIEMRVSELLHEKQKNEKNVITLKDVDEVIAVMGQPEDYILEDDTTAETVYRSTARGTRKLYRDKEKGMIGGVASGLSYYFGVDAVWIRILLILLVFAGFGTGILAYVILWIVTPEAVTTSEKLEMTGEPVTISNIEKKVRAEFENVSDKFKKGEYDKYGNQIKTGAGKLGNSLGDFIMTVFKIFAKILGIILILAGLAMIIVFLVGALTLGSANFSNFPFHQFIESGNFTDYPVWVFGALVFLAVGIPNFFVMLLGFKLVSPNLKSIGNIAKYTLLAIWIVVIAVLISIGVKQASAFAVSGRVVKKEIVNISPIDTLLIKFVHNNYFAKNVNDRNEFMVTQDSIGTDIIYSNEVRLKIERTNDKLPYIQIEKEAKGKSLSEAKKRAEKIRYSYRVEGTSLIFDNFLLTDLRNKYRDQEIEITLFLPKGTLLKPDDSMEKYDNTDSDYFLWNLNSSNDIYRVEENTIRCINCDTNENLENNSNNASDSTQTSITINENGVSIKADTLIESKKKFKGLTINKDGIIIKTN